MLNPQIIYIIDDDLDDQFFLIEAIREVDTSVECYTAVNGQEALKTLEANTIPIPSLIFLDLNMPRIGGHKFLIEIKKLPRFKNIPVVIYSTSSNEKDKTEMLQLGAAKYLVKDADFSLLKQNLFELLSLV